MDSSVVPTVAKYDCLPFELGLGDGLDLFTGFNHRAKLTVR